MTPIKIAIAGIGNCASSLLQGIEYYRNDPSEDLGLMHRDLGGFGPEDIRVVAAFDIDVRKVDRPLHEAIFAPPNSTKTIWKDVPNLGVTVKMGPVLDGVADHMKEYHPDRTFVPAEADPVDVEAALRESGAEILLNYMPVGSEEAARFYAEAALATGVSFINCMPVFIVSESGFAKRFADAGIPVVGDDVKAQLGATILHRTLAKLFADRGVKIKRTYQLNTGGNTDFLNMLERSRLHSKKISKTSAVQSQLGQPLEADNIHIGPSDYVPWQDDNKICFLRIEGEGFGGIPLEIEARLSVEDSPNSAGVVIDAIRLCRIARDRGEAGPLYPVSAYFMKHPPIQISDTAAKQLLEEFVAGTLRASEPVEMTSGRDSSGHSGL
ncbi:MAG TPA: inositol-3-phosphate synthase [Nitrospinae bacterium]|nr:inositol-3-phosphate synthase [Nitrospinota bacterium]